MNEIKNAFLGDLFCIRKKSGTKPIKTKKLKLEKKRINDINNIIKNNMH